MKICYRYVSRPEEAEELAKRIMPEVDNRARVKKLFQVIYGRDATEEEIKLGIDYIKSEPMLSRLFARSG